MGKKRNRSTLTISRSLGKLKTQGNQIVSPKGFRAGIDLPSPKQQEELQSDNEAEMKEAIKNSSGPMPTPIIQYDKKQNLTKFVAPEISIIKRFGQRINSTVNLRVNKPSVNFDLSSNLGDTHPNTTVNSRPQTQHDKIGETQTIISYTNSAPDPIQEVNLSAAMFELKQELLDEQKRAKEKIDKENNDFIQRLEILQRMAPS